MTGIITCDISKNGKKELYKDRKNNALGVKSWVVHLDLSSDILFLLSSVSNTEQEIFTCLCLRSAVQDPRDPLVICSPCSNCRLSGIYISMNVKQEGSFSSTTDLRSSGSKTGSFPVISKGHNTRYVWLSVNKQQSHSCWH